MKHWNIRLNNQLFYDFILYKNNNRRTRRRENKGERTQEPDTQDSPAHIHTREWRADGPIVCLFVWFYIVGLSFSLTSYSSSLRTSCYAINNGLWSWRLPINQNVHVSENMTNSSTLCDAGLSINCTSKTIEAGDRKLMLPSSHLLNMKSAINKSSLLEFSPVVRDQTILIASLKIWSIQSACINMQMVDRREGWKPKQVVTQFSARHESSLKASCK